MKHISPEDRIAFRLYNLTIEEKIEYLRMKKWCEKVLNEPDFIVGLSALRLQIEKRKEYEERYPTT